MINIAVGKLLLNTAGLCLTDCTVRRSTTPPDWTLNDTAMVAAVWSAGKRLHVRSVPHMQPSRETCPEPGVRS